MSLKENLAYYEDQANKIREKLEEEEQLELFEEEDLLSQLYDNGKPVKKVACGLWCFVFGLSANGAGCQLEKDHEGDHRLSIVSINPQATFNVFWNTGEINVSKE